MADGGERPDQTILVVDLEARTVVLGLVIVAAAAATVGLVRAAPLVMTWLVVGGLLALALNPVVDGVEGRLRCRRATALVIVLALLGAFITVVVLLLGPETARQARTLRDDIPSVAEDLADIPLIGPTLERNDVPARVEGWIDDLPETAAGATDTIEASARSAVGGVLAAAGVFMITVTLLLDGERLLHGARRLVPPGARDRADAVARTAYDVVGRYFAGSLLVAVLQGLYVLAVGLAFGVPLAPLLAVSAAIFNLVPQIGGALAGIPFVLLALTQGAATGVICAVLFILYMNFENHVLQPLIVGDAVDLSPPTTMMAAIIGVAVAGVPGALVAVPMVGVGKALYLQSKGEQPQTGPRPGPWARLRQRVARRRNSNGPPEPPR